MHVISGSGEELVIFGWAVLAVSIGSVHVARVQRGKVVAAQGLYRWRYTLSASVFTAVSTEQPKAVYV